MESLWVRPKGPAWGAMHWEWPDLLLSSWSMSSIFPMTSCWWTGAGNPMAWNLFFHHIDLWFWSKTCEVRSTGARAFICCDSTFCVTCSPQPHAHSHLCIMVRGQGNFTYTSIKWKKGKKEKIEFKWGRYGYMSTRKGNPKPWGTIRRLKYNMIRSYLDPHMWMCIR